jgi:predicted dehydrogenase
MFGGGRGAFIGPSNGWQLGRLDDRFQLVTGAVPSDKNNAKLSAQDLGIASDRACLSYAEILEAERQRSDSIDVVSIVTSNHVHFEVNKAFLDAGIRIWVLVKWLRLLIS